MRKVFFSAVMLLLPVFSSFGQNVVEKRDTLTESRVISEKQHRENFTQTGMTRIDGKKLRGGYATFSTPDLIKVLQTLPGVASGTELLSGLYVHGGDGSDNLFLLDGVPIYQVSHVAGLFSSFNTDIVDNLEFYKSGFPARYGGKMSSVVDVTTKDGDFEKYHGSFSLSIIDGRLSLGGPIVKGRTSFNLGLRRSWLDAVTIPAIAYINKENNKSNDPGEREDANFHYAFDDFNFRLTHIFKPGSKLTFNTYQGNDGINIRYDEMYVHDYRKDMYYSPEGDDSKTLTNYEDDMDVKVNWGNFTSSLAWDKEYSDKLHSNIKAYYTQSRSNIFFGIYDYSDDFYDSGRKETSSDEISEKNVCAVKDWSLVGDMDWYPAASHHVRAGAQYQYHTYGPERTYHAVLRNSEFPEEDYSFDESFSDRFGGSEGSLYVEDEIALSKTIRANVGVRGAFFFVPGKTYARVEPRAAVKWQFADASALKLSYSEMNQFNHLVATTYLDLPTNCWMPSTALIKPSLSRQVAGGVYNDWPSGMRLYVEGYWKTMENLLEYGGTNALFPPLNAWESNFYKGMGRSYGAEFEWGYDTRKWSLAAYYTLSWSERKFDDFYFDWYPDRNDNRHKINLSVTWHPSKKFELYAMWNYHSGNHLTTASHVVAYEYEFMGYDWETGEERIYKYIAAEDLFTRPNNLTLPDYHRLDLGLNFHRTTRHGNQATWNISVYNAYCRMNPIVSEVGRNSDHKLVEFTYGIVPIIPTFGYTLSF